VNIILFPFKLLLRLYVALTGSISAYTTGIVQNYSPEHQRFLRSGFTCASCRSFLIKKTLVADIIVKDEEGNIVPLMETKSRGRYAYCPRCNYKWPLRKDQSVSETT